MSVRGYTKNTPAEASIVSRTTSRIHQLNQQINAMKFISAFIDNRSYCQKLANERGLTLVGYGSIWITLDDNDAIVAESFSAIDCISKALCNK